MPERGEPGQPVDPREREDGGAEQRVLHVEGPEVGPVVPEALEERWHRHQRQRREKRQKQPAAERSDPDPDLRYWDEHELDGLERVAQYVGDGVRRGVAERRV